MVARGPGVFGIIPSIGIVVEAKDKVGLDGVVNEVGAGTNLGGAIEEFISGDPVGEIRKKVLWALFCNGLEGVADEGDFGSKFF